MDVSDLTRLQAKELELSKIDGRKAGQSESPRITTFGMNMNSTKYTYSPPGQEL